MSRAYHVLSTPATTAPQQPLATPAGVRQKQHIEYQRLQRNLRAMISLGASLESIQASGQVSKATNLLAVQQLESMGIVLDMTALESNLDDPLVIHEAALEGLSKAFASMANRLKSWYERRRDEDLARYNKSSQIAKNILQSATTLRGELTRLDANKRFSMDVSRYGAWVTTSSDRNPKLENISKALKDGLEMAEEFAKRTAHAVDFNKALIAGIDVSSDAAFAKTYLSKLPAALKLHVQQLPPTAAALGTRELRFDKEFTDENRKLFLEGKQLDGVGNLKAYDRKIDLGKMSIDVTVGQIVQMLDSVIWLAREISSGSYGRRYAALDEAFYQNAVTLFMIEEGEYRDQARFVPELREFRYFNGYLQQATSSIWSYIGLGAFDTLLVCCEGARAGFQLARQALTEAKN